MKREGREGGGRASIYHPEFLYMYMYIRVQVVHVILTTITMYICMNIMYGSHDSVLESYRFIVSYKTCVQPYPYRNAESTGQLPIATARSTLGNSDNVTQEERMTFAMESVSGWSGSMMFLWQCS